MTDVSEDGEIVPRAPHWVDGEGICTGCGQIEPPEGSECPYAKQGRIRVTVNPVDAGYPLIVLTVVLMFGMAMGGLMAWSILSFVWNYGHAF